MKQKKWFKGIITALLLLIVGLLPLTAKPAMAYAGNADPKLNVKSKALVKGKDYALKVYNLTETQTVTYASEDIKIASVDEFGVVTALSVGTTVVTATIEDSKSDESIELHCKITVGPPAIFIKLSRMETDLTVGQRALMYWLVGPLNTVEQPKFSSSAPEVASVSAGGVVTAKSEGRAYIFAQIDNGHYDLCLVTVTAESAEVAPASSEPDVSFADFLIKLNENFTNGADTSENTGADAAQ